MEKLSANADGGKPDSRLTHFIAIGSNMAWGRGRTFRLAVQNMHRSGPERAKRFEVYAVSADTYVNDMGGLNRPQGDPAPVLLKALNQTSKDAEAKALLASF